MTFEAHQRTLTGTDPLTFVNVVEGLKVDALGVNCSLGPVELLPIVKTILKYASVPVIVQPNAGLPCLEHGQTCYPMQSDEFVEAMKEYAQLGVNIIGGCCGTTPEFIAGLKAHLPSYSQPREEESICKGKSITSCNILMIVTMTCFSSIPGKPTLTSNISAPALCC